MSAVQTVLVETSSPLKAATAVPFSEEKICELVHELRQPLSSIEAIAYYLEMTLPADQVQTRHYMRRLQQLVDQASVVLQRSVSDIRKP